MQADKKMLTKIKTFKKHRIAMFYPWIDQNVLYVHLYQ